jgi:hypothetical protein
MSLESFFLPVSGLSICQANRVNLLTVHFDSDFASKVECHCVTIKCFAYMLNIKVPLITKPIIKRGRKSIMLQRFSCLVIRWQK